MQRGRQLRQWHYAYLRPNRSWQTSLAGVVHLVRPLAPPTSSAESRVISRKQPWFLVDLRRSNVHNCRSTYGFDSRQLHNKIAGHSHKRHDTGAASVEAQLSIPQLLWANCLAEQAP
jgi:hypothetical protein